MAHPFGRLSIRKLFVFVAGFLAATFGLAALSSAPVYAAPDAHWEGTQISYAENIYTRTDDGAADDPRGIPEDAAVFSYTDQSVWPNKIHYIYFASNSDPNTAEQALYTSATYDPTKPDAEAFTDISEPEVISIAVYNDPDAAATSCNQEGIGWVICPLTNWLAKGMDTLYSLISGFLEVRPAQTSTDNPLYRAWSVMRNFANVLFMVGFLAIIYSQITSVGISNYHIKKLLPRLIIAAVLVNISYWVCALAIDASNVLGYSIQDIFINIREGLVGPSGNSWELINWQSITGAVLAAGAGATALTIGTVAFVASAGSSIFLLLPILVGVIMAVLVALLIMAARQAIITILLVISPLAFVAFLLPNTEKYFEKWRSLGLTMLMLFPIFSVIFGGSQLAGALIIQNADQINLVILGLAVQVAPLVITPFLIRFSGSLLGRIAGIINNPNKGLIDRTRKWSQERADQMKSRQLAQGNNWMARRARGLDSRRRNREGLQRANDTMTEANWGGTSRAQEIQQYAMKAAETKDIADSTAQAAYHASKATSAEMQELDIKARAAKLDVDLSKARIDANWEEVLAGDSRNMVIPENLSISALADFAHTRNSTAKSIHGKALQNHIENRRSHSAQYMQKKSFARDLLASEDLQRQAGGIGGQEAADSALASAIAEKRKAYGDAVAEASQIIKQFNLSGEQRQKLAMGQSVTGIDDSTGLPKVLDGKATYVREAAIEAQLGGEGRYKDIEEIIMKSGSELREFRTTIGDALASNKLSGKAVYLGGQTINDVKQGAIKNEAGLNQAVAITIAKGKVQPAHLASMDSDAVKRLVDVAVAGARGEGFNLDQVSQELADTFADQIAELKASAETAATIPAIKGSIASNVWPELERLVGHSLRPNKNRSQNQP
jgi:hypothetical protein